MNTTSHKQTVARFWPVDSWNHCKMYPYFFFSFFFYIRGRRRIFFPIFYFVFLSISSCNRSLRIATGNRGSDRREKRKPGKEIFQWKQSGETVQECAKRQEEIIQEMKPGNCSFFGIWPKEIWRCERLNFQATRGDCGSTTLHLASNIFLRCFVSYLSLPQWGSREMSNSHIC